MVQKQNSHLPMGGIDQAPNHSHLVSHQTSPKISKRNKKMYKDIQKTEKKIGDDSVLNEGYHDLQEK